MSWLESIWDSFFVAHQVLYRKDLKNPPTAVGGILEFSLEPIASARAPQLESN
jgi:hypothetical protein